MKIFIIDDDPAMLRVAYMLLAQLGHEARTFIDPREALNELNAGVDLVITDVAMPQIDGFAVAARVAAILGTTPPRTLLITGGDHHARLWASLPECVISIMRKPISLVSLKRVMDFLSLSRNRCPGLVLSELSAGKAGDDYCKKYGEDSSYSRCPHYNTRCGAALRDWVCRD